MLSNAVVKSVSVIAKLEPLVEPEVEILFGFF